MKKLLLICLFGLLCYVSPAEADPIPGLNDKPMAISTSFSVEGGTMIANGRSRYKQFRKIRVRVSFYTNLPSENGGWTITATQKELAEGMVAAPEEFSYGTRFYIEGMDEVVVKEDCGGAIYIQDNGIVRLDYFVARIEGEDNDTYLRRVNNMGIRYYDAYVIDNKGE